MPPANASIRSLGLWLAPHESEVTPKKQIPLLRRQLEGDAPDVLLFPEAWMNGWGLRLDARATDTAIRRAVADKLTEWGLPPTQRCLVGIELPLVLRDIYETALPTRQILVDTQPGSVPYRKHSTADEVAFEDRRWTPNRALPLWRGGIGPTICHDVYLSLLSHFHASQGCALLVNPSGFSVLARKWRTMHQARAIENRTPIACTMQDDPAARNNKAVCFVFDPQGAALPLRSAHDPTLEGDVAGRLYVADLTEGGEPLTEGLEAKPPTSDEGYAVKIQGDQLQVGTQKATWGSDRHIAGHRLVSLAEPAFRDPCAWLAPFIEEAGGCLFWVRVADRSRAAAVTVAAAKAVELSSPVVVEAETKPLVVVELYNLAKAVRVVSPARINPKWQKGFDSAFKMTAGKAERANAWHDHVKQYATLIGSCRR